MQRLKGRNIVFGALAVLACSGDPTGNESTPTAIQSNPDPVFVTQGDSQPVIVQVLDEDGNVLQADFTATNVGSGITVRLDPTYQQVTTGNPIQRGARFFVTGVSLAHTSFTVNALGLSQEIEVTSVPGELDAEITDSLPDLGDTISITAPTGTFFTDSSSVSFNGAEAVITTKDATTITFIPMPNVDGPALVTNVGVESNSAVVFALTTPFRIKTDSIPDIGTTISNLAPALGDPITLTLPAGLRVIPESLIQSGVGADTLPRGMSVAGVGVQPIGITVSPDSSTITFVPPPNADSFVVVPGIIPQRLATCCGGVPNYPLTLGTTAKVLTPVIDSVPVTLSPSTTLAANEPVTLTRTDAAFGFAAGASVLVGADPSSVVLSVAGDGSSMTFLPPPGSSGAVTVNGVSLAGFSLTLPAKAPSITVDTIVPAAGTDDPGTAPPLPLPGAVGETTAFWDTPDFDPLTGTVDRFYGFNVPANGNYRVSINWDVGDDVDGILCTDATCSAFVAGLQENPPLTDLRFVMATSTQPEVGTFALTPASHVLLVEDFGGADDDPNTAPAIGAKLLITITRLP